MPRILQIPETFRKNLDKILTKSAKNMNDIAKNLKRKTNKKVFSTKKPPKKIHLRGNLGKPKNKRGKQEVSRFPLRFSTVFCGGKTRKAAPFFKISVVTTLLITMLSPI